MSLLNDTIFRHTDVLKSTGMMLSFDDCPNKCRDGYYIDPYKHSKVQCEYCKNKRIEITKNKVSVVDYKTNKNIEGTLNLPSSLNGMNYDFDSLFVASERKKFTEESVDLANQELNELMNNASIGLFPDYSVFINLGIRANHMNFIYPYMMRLYQNGVNICPLLTPIDIIELRQEFSDNKIGNSSIKYTDLLKRSACIIYLDAASQSSSILTVKGLMELRALRGMSTVIVTGLYNSSSLELTTKDEKIKNLAHIIEVIYEKKEDKGKTVRKASTQSIGNNSMSDSEFKRLMGRS